MIVSLSSSVVGGNSGVIKRCVDLFFKTFLGKNFVNKITEFSPANVLTFLGGFELGGKNLEFWLTDHNFSHAQTNSKLGISNVAGSQLVEVSEKFGNTNASLFGNSSDSGKDILKVFGGVSHDLSLTNSWLSFGEIVKTVIEVATNTKQVF